MSAQGGKAFISSHTAIMGTRTSFRPRPLDTLRQLNIVRDVKELDDGEQKVSRDIVHSHEALDKDNEEVCDHASQETVAYCLRSFSCLRQHPLLCMISRF